MRKSQALIASVALLASPMLALAGELTPAEKTFFDQHASDVVQVEPARLDDPALVKVFAVPFFTIKLTIKSPDGAQTQDLIVYRSDDKLVGVSTGHTDGDLPDLVKMFNANFKLKTNDDAKTLQKALDVVSPIVSDDDKKAATFKHSGKQWTFVRGKFFDSKMGYVFTTDDKGTITAAKYVMKLP